MYILIIVYTFTIVYAYTIFSMCGGVCTHRVGGSLDA